MQGLRINWVPFSIILVLTICAAIFTWFKEKPTKAELESAPKQKGKTFAIREVAIVLAGLVLSFFSSIILTGNKGDITFNLSAAIISFILLGLIGVLTFCNAKQKDGKAILAVLIVVINAFISIFSGFAFKPNKENIEIIFPPAEPVQIQNKAWQGVWADGKGHEIIITFASDSYNNGSIVIRTKSTSGLILEFESTSFYLETNDTLIVDSSGSSIYKEFSYDSEDSVEIQGKLGTATLRYINNTNGNEEAIIKQNTDYKRISNKSHDEYMKDEMASFVAALN